MDCCDVEQCGGVTSVTTLANSATKQSSLVLRRADFRGDPTTRLQRDHRPNRRYDPERIPLSGSFTKGKSDQYTVVDLIVVSDDVERPTARDHCMWQLFYGLTLQAVLMFHTREEVADAERARNSFMAAVLRLGVQVYRWGAVGRVAIASNG
jgi:hypothetical protein